MDKPEALRLADALDECKYVDVYRCKQAAAELRRLHAENEAFNAENEKLRSERTLLVRKVEALETDIEIERRLSFRNQVAKLDDENEALLEALKQIEPILARMYGTQAKDLPPMQIVRAAIAKAEGENT